MVPGERLAERLTGHEEVGGVRGVAGVLQPRRCGDLRREAVAIRHEPGAVGQQQSTAAIQVGSDVGCQLGAERQVIRQDQHLVGREIRGLIQELEEAVQLQQHPHSPFIHIPPDGVEARPVFRQEDANLAHWCSRSQGSRASIRP